uniref:DNA polymerase epsilon catalytic subunit n=1 Tax=Haemonchus contortus TaxID=6289 RepID=A0A7I4XU50_HAECO
FQTFYLLTVTMSDEPQIDVDQLQMQAVETDANYEERVQKIKFNDVIDAKFGYERYTGSTERDAWLINFQPAELVDELTKTIISAVDFYFVEESGERFKISYPFRPYFYISATDGAEHHVASVLSKKYGGFLVVEIVDKEDLDLKNHLSGLKKTYIKLSFPSLAELTKVKRDLMPLVRKNKIRIKKESQYCSYLARNMGGSNYDMRENDVLNDILDIREHDLPYHMRVAIDEKYFVGKWYRVKGISSTRKPSIVSHPTLIDPIEPVVLAFDIETTKLPLKFPDPAMDEIMMISYMVDGKGFLIINRDIVAAEIESFEYTPKEEYKGEFFIFNEPDETATIRRFFDHILQIKPNIIVTYNGDFFDWPFVETRAQIRGMGMESEIGFAKDSADEFKNRNCIHMDAFRWVKRDSYLPVGSQNLKAVAKAKLRYDPVEVDPEEMCKMAREDPQSLANYSVSDAVATYYLYMKYVHPFVFALCTIIPLGPDDVLRKGSGTLCEALLMVEAFHNNIVFPNKYTEDDESKSTKDGHRIESETYVGGHVEALEAGVFRADIPCRFRLAPAALKSLHDSVHDTLAKELLREYNIPVENVIDFDERCAEVQQAFNDLMAIPARMENPRIYHLDVGAMYPNIILTNRLQPCAMVNEEICMACSYNRPDAKCKRVMSWEWRGELTPATRGELQQIIQQLEGETFGKPPKPFHQLEKSERQTIEKKRIQDYSRRVYGRTHLTRLEMRQTMICQRENAFYVDTVRAFRDRRYDYKELLKRAKSSLDELSKDDIAGIKAAKGRIVLYESLQLAHKCILNSFYGYVMRKGSRWFSMEMAGIVCYTGAQIITEARKLVEQIGKPLELDTDGIWCLLPASFPENVTFALQNCKRKSITISYPGAMLNAVVNMGFTNDQYHNLQPDGSYSISKENSIFFEVDGPYQCMVLPASKEEGKKLKKRYAVFNLDGSLAELKGFEVKRRGELNIIKHFQSAVFKAFLRGTTLAEVYDSASREADHWLDVLFSKGGSLSDMELFDLISENRSMSRKLEDYGAQKSTSISTAKRLAEFLGSDMVKDAGLACKFVISRHPIGAPVTDRAVPIAIFQAEEKVRCHYLRQWTKQPGLPAEKMNIRELLDWDYYIERLGSCIQKIITIPAALQGLPNPVERIPHPDWLANKIKNRFDAVRQPRITDLFQKKAPDEIPLVINDNGKRSRDEMEQEETSDKDEENKENDPKKQRAVPETMCQATTEPLAKKTLARDGFDEWLRYLKKKWRLVKVNNLTRRRDRGATMVERMLSNTRESMRERIWQVLSLEETRTPGIYNIWVALEGRMERFQLRVPRIVIINEREPSEGKDVVRRVLPHHKPVYYLYEHIISGNAEQKLMNEINEKLCCSRIEGIYESQTPLMFRALTQIGCLCRPMAPPIGGVYSLETLRMISTDQSYLSTDSIRSIFLYKFAQDTRQVWAMVDTVSSSGFFFIVQRGEVAMPNVDRVYSQSYDEEKDLMTSSSHVPQGIKFTTRHFRVAAEAEKEVNKMLRVSREASAKPTLLCLLVDEEPRTMMKRIVHLTLFPHIRIHVQEPQSLLNVMEWQRVIAKRVCKHYFNSFIYLKDYIEWACYLNIPIGSVPNDAGLFGLDLFFARNLQRAGHVLWASPSSRPDLGGKELDDLRLSADWRPLTADETVLLNTPSFCGSICIEFALEAVAVTALVQRGRLLEAEGADDTVAFDSSVALPSEIYNGLRNTISAFDEGAAVDAALKVLKQMLTECVRDIAHSANKRADQVVMSLSRWLHSSNALLFDSAITRSVAILEKKLVLLLAAECERLGAKIIYATPTRLVLDTGKCELDQGKAFTDLLLQSLGQNPLFAALNMRSVRVWSTLLWYDGHNFTGICEKLVETVDEDSQPSQQLKAETQHYWRMSDDLPIEGAIREEFRKIVTGYVMLFMQEQRKMNFDTESAVKFRNDLIRQHIGHRLFRVISKLAGQSLTHSAAASLVNVICTALLCDSAVEDSVEGLRENLQRILDTREFPPTRNTVYLSNLFCSNCSLATDIDVGDEMSWTCKECGQSFAKSDIDQMISDRLNMLMTAYLLQDHVCTKCRSIRRDNISKYCECSGVFANTITAAELLRDAKTACDIGQQFDLPITVEISQWMCAGVAEVDG